MAMLQTEHPHYDEKAAGVLATEDIVGDRLPSWTEAEEKAVRRKLDLAIVPVVTILYLLCFLDRANVGNARIQGMSKELHLVGYRFNWALTVFYFTYIIVEVPSNVILKKVGPRFWIPFLVFGFGVISMCTAFVKNFHGLVACRALLGIMEGGTMPGISFFLSCFYKRKELLFRIGIFVSAASMAGAFGGLLATGFSRIPVWGTHAARIHAWRNIFFFEGIITIIAAALAPLFLPQSPETCKWLTERQRFIAAERLALEHKSDPNEKVTWHHVKLAVCNTHNVLMAAGFFVINITVQSFSLFLPSILNDLGWTATKSQLYSVPPYIVACVVAITVAFVSDKTHIRGPYLAFFAIVSVIGFALLRVTNSASVKYGAVFLAAAGSFPGGPAFLSWGLNNSAGPAVRAVAGAYIVSIGTFGAIVATWTYVSKDAPKYHTGHSINLGANVAAFFIAIISMAYCWWENKVRRQGGRDHRLQGLSLEEQRNLGHRHPEFRYIL